MMMCTFVNSLFIYCFLTNMIYLLTLRFVVSALMEVMEIIIIGILK